MITRRKEVDPGGSVHRGERASKARRPRRGLLVGLSLSLVFVAGAYAAVLATLRPPSQGAQITLDDVIRYSVCQAARTSGTFVSPLLPTGSAGPSGTYCQDVNRRVSSATFLDEDSRILGTLVNRDGGNPTPFWATYPKSDAATANLIDTMAAGQTKVVVDAQSGTALVRFVAQFILPLVLLANLFALLFYFVQRAGGGVAEFVRFGTVGKKASAMPRRQTTFADVAAADEAVAELAEVRDYLRSPESFAAMGALPPKGLLLMGPPGCGKTLLGRAVAGEAAASFFAMSGSEFVESLVGIGAARVRDLFAQARAVRPSIVFIDELDAVGRQRGTGVGQGHDEREQTLNELLVQMDGFSPAEGLVVLAATNRPDILDPALLRAGRFDRHVTVERPDLDGRLAILTLHAQGRRLADPEHDLPQIARSTAGFTGADLANLLNEAALLAVRDHATAITRAHLDEGVERVIGGPRRRGHLLSDEEKQAAAYHEAGHAIVAAALGKAGSIEKVSIIARGRGVGHLALLQEERTIVRRSNLEVQIAIAMAGLAVEELVFGEGSTGCEQDVERATHAARDLAGRYGLSDRLGPVRILAGAREVFLGRDYLETRDVSPPTLEELDVEVRRIVEEQRAEARAILNTNRTKLDTVAAALVESETLQGPELRTLLAGLNPEAEAASTA